MIKKFGENIPFADKTAWVAENAYVIGRVKIGPHSSVWYNSTIRGDINDIRIGDTSNIQDNSIIHVSDKLPCIIGNFVTVGHGVILHACEIDDYSLIGMGSIVMDGCKIGRGSIVAAGAVLTKGTIVPPFSLFAGIPAKCIKELSENDEKNALALALKYKKLYMQHHYGSDLN